MKIEKQLIKSTKTTIRMKNNESYYFVFDGIVSNKEVIDNLKHNCRIVQYFCEREGQPEEVIFYGNLYGLNGLNIIARFRLSDFPESMHEKIKANEHRKNDIYISEMIDIVIDLEEDDE